MKRIKTSSLFLYFTFQYSNPGEWLNFLEYRKQFSTYIFMKMVITVSSSSNSKLDQVLCAAWHTARFIAPSHQGARIIFLLVRAPSSCESAVQTIYSFQVIVPLKRVGWSLIFSSFKIIHRWSVLSNFLLKFHKILWVQLYEAKFYFSTWIGVQNLKWVNVYTRIERQFNETLDDFYIENDCSPTMKD